jgi:ribulose-phosphate 3-epimerase
MLQVLERHPASGWLHLDVMDGAFVPNISFGPPVIRSLAGKTKLRFDVHLMVEEPGRFMADYVTENTEYLVVHQEACLHLDRTLQLIQSLGVKCGVALNPATPLSALEYVLDKVDQVLVMGVNPGFGGQSFLPVALAKMKALSEWRQARGLDFKIATDGGVNAGNLQEIAAAGADIIVVGSAITNAEDPSAVLEQFGSILEGGA